MVGVGGGDDGDEDEERNGEGEGGGSRAAGKGHWRREWPAGQRGALLSGLILFLFSLCLEGDCCMAWQWSGQDSEEVFEERLRHSVRTAGRP